MFAEGQAGDIYFEVHGDGRPVLVMGGWGSYCHGKAGTLPRPVLEHSKVILFDYRGIGSSDRDPDLAPSMLDYAQDALAVLDALGIERVHLVGLVGMGGCVSQAFAARFPERTLSIFQMGSWANVSTLMRDQLATLVEIHREHGFELFQRVVAQYSFKEGDYEKYRDKILGASGAWGELFGRQDVHASLVQACLDHDARDWLGEVSCPAAVVHAARDAITSVDVTKRMSGLLKGCLELHEDFGHVVVSSKDRLRLGELIVSFQDRVDSELGVRQRA